MLCEGAEGSEPDLSWHLYAGKTQDTSRRRKGRDK